MVLSPLPLLLALSIAADASELFQKAIDAANRARRSEASELFQKIIDEHPSSPEAAKAPLWLGASPILAFEPVHVSGPSSQRIDLIALGEAFEARPGDQRLFQRWAGKAFEHVFDGEVFEEYGNYFNTHVASVASKDGRVDQNDRRYDTALDGQKIGQASQVTVSHDKVKHYLGGLPIDDGFAFVIVQDEGAPTGWGGVGVLPGEPEREDVLRTMGYAFAGLAAEFSTSTHEQSAYPQESVNIATIDDPKRVPWAHWIRELPNKVGVYEGGGGVYKGVFRPTADGCVLRGFSTIVGGSGRSRQGGAGGGNPNRPTGTGSTGGREFCVVCREAVVLKIYEHVSPVDDATPGNQLLRVPASLKQDLEVFVKVKDPRRHRIQAQFYFSALDDQHQLPAGISWVPLPENAPNPARIRGVKEPPQGWTEVEATSKTERGVVSYTVDLKKVLRSEKAKPGRYGIVALVTDPGSVGREKWVIRDPDHLLRELLVWQVEVFEEP